MLLADKLSVPLAEASLLESIRSNLLPEIQHELLYQDVTTIGQLRCITSICTRESFFQTLRPVVRKPQPAPRRLVHEVEASTEVDLEEEDVSCWNSGKAGHRYQDCISERRVFCYGCGKADTYKPACSQCSAPKNCQVRWKGARKQMVSRATSTE